MLGERPLNAFENVVADDRVVTVTFVAPANPESVPHWNPTVTVVADPRVPT